jgi:predicted nucleic acid-binding protein
VLLAARLLLGAEIELVPTRSLFEAATRMSIEIDHSAYDCLYLAPAVEKNASLLQRTNAFCGSCIRADNTRFAAERSR